MTHLVQSIYYITKVRICKKEGTEEKKNPHISILSIANVNCSLDRHEYKKKN